MLKRNVQKGMISLIAIVMFLSLFSFTNLNSIKTVEAATTSYNTIEYNKSVNLDANIAYPETNAFWSAPYYSEGSTFISSATAPSYAKKDVKLVREAKTERGIYYQVKLGDKIIGWLDKRAFKFYEMPSTDIAYSRTGKITNTTGHAVWTQPCGQINSTLKGPASDYLNKEITIWRKVENKRGTYYQFSETKTPNIKAWLDARAITLYDQVHFNEEYNQMAVISTVIGHAVWSTPYLQSDSKLIAPASNYEGKRVEIIRRAKTTRSIYYQFSYNNKVIGWLDTRAFSLIPSNNAMVISNSTNDIFSNITDAYNKNSPINNSQNYSQQFVNIDESNFDDNLGNYVKISQDNKLIGWIDSENVVDEKTMDSIENDEESIIPEELIDKVNDYVTIENNEFVLSDKAEDVLTSEEFVEVEGQIDQTNAEIEVDESLSDTHVEGNTIVQEIYEDEPNQLLKAAKKAYIKAKYTWWGVQIQFSHKAVVDFNDFYWGAGMVGGLGANKRMGKFLVKKGIKIASRYTVCLSLFGSGLAWGMSKKDKGKGVNLNCVLYIPTTITTAK